MFLVHKKDVASFRTKLSNSLGGTIILFPKKNAKKSFAIIFVIFLLQKNELKYNTLPI
jgi:hypothetical protein